MIFAFGRDGSLPNWFAHVHHRYRTPDVAIVIYTSIAFVLSVFGSFDQLAVLSNVAILLMYLMCCAATWLLIRRDVRADASPFNFRGANVVPVLAIAAILWILTQASLSQSSVGNDTRAGLRVAAIVVVIASAVYVVVRGVRRRG